MSASVAEKTEMTGLSIAGIICVYSIILSYKVYISYRSSSDADNEDETGVFI